MDQETRKSFDSIAQELEKRKEERKTGITRKRFLRRSIRRILVLFAGAFLLLAMIFLVNFIRLNSDLIEGTIKKGVIPQITRGVIPLEVGKVSGNLFYGIELNQLVIRNPHFSTGGVMLTIPKIALRYSLFDVFFGSLVLERVTVEDPVLYLSRDPSGLAIWNFNPGTAAAPIAPPPEPPKTSYWEGTGHTEFRTDRYLRSIEIKNLTILAPKPRDLFPDKFLTRLLRLPPGNLNLGQIDVTLRKFPKRDFTSLLLEIGSRGSPSAITLQVARIRHKGDLTVSLSAFKHQMELSVQNVGQQGKLVTLFDSRHRERLNLRFGLKREPLPVLRRITGLKGTLEMGSLETFRELLPEGTHIAGSVHMDFAASEAVPLSDTLLELSVGNGVLKTPWFPELSELHLELAAKERVAEISSFSCRVGSFTTTHSGSLTWNGRSDFSASLTSSLGEEKVRLKAGIERVDPVSRRFSLSFIRDRGKLTIEGMQDQSGGLTAYKDILVDAHLDKDGSLWEILPTKVLPARVKEKLATFLERMDVRGPLTFVARIPSPTDLPAASGTLILDGAKLINRSMPRETLDFGGKALLAAGRLDLETVFARLDSLKIGLQGHLEFGNASEPIKGYLVDLIGSIEDGKPFSLTGKRLAERLGLPGPPPFDLLEIEGKELFKTSLSHLDEGQKVKLALDKVRLKRKGRVFSADGVRLTAASSERVDLVRPRPRNLDIAGEMRLFGLPFSAKASLDVASSRFKEFSLDGRGEDFSILLSALEESPPIRKFCEDNGFSLAGKFALSLSGKGVFGRPSMSGTIRFPRLEAKTRLVEAVLPFDLALDSPSEGEYRGNITTTGAKLRVKGTEFLLEKMKGNFSFSKPAKSRERVLAIDAGVSVFGTEGSLKSSILPNDRIIRSLSIRLETKQADRLANEIARIGKFNIPFNLSGKSELAIQASGTFDALTSRGTVSVDDLCLKFPIRLESGKTLDLDFRNSSGVAGFVQPAADRFQLNLTGIRTKLLGGDVSLDGAGHLEKREGGFAPFLDEVKTEIASLPLSGLFDLLSERYFPQAVRGRVSEVGGTLSGTLTLAGGRNRFRGTGKARLADGSFRFQGLGDSFREISAQFGFSDAGTGGKRGFDLADCSFSFRRSRFTLPHGRLSAPERTADIELDGTIDRAFPSDMVALMAGLDLPKLSFPKESPLAGKISLRGTLAAPRLQFDLETGETDVQYHSGEHLYQVPVGKSRIGLEIDLGDGSVNARPTRLGILRGTLDVREARGRVARGKPSEFRVTGNMEGIDLGSFTAGGESALKAVLGGDFEAEQKPGGAREAVFRLSFRDMQIPDIPVDQQIIDQIGLEFLDRPEFREGRLNLYLSSEEEQADRGKIRVADGLFAGPEMRLEISNSAFDPARLELAGRVMFNPQPLRTTKLGKKLGTMTRLLQDKETGVPYLDLSVSGTWEKPSLIGKAILDRAKKRAKKNFIKSIFGGRRSHKASVEELRQWFPGWEPGK